MSGALSPKDTRKILKHLETQGCELVQTRDGVRVLFPDGKGSTMFHWTPSDSRGTMNTRAEVRRAGLTWPGDIERNKEKKKMTTLTLDQVRSVRGVLERLEREGAMSGTIEEMAEEAGVSVGTMNRRLHKFGWHYVGKVNGRSRWEKKSLLVSSTPIEYPEIERAKQLVAKMPSDVSRETSAFGQALPPAHTDEAEPVGAELITAEPEETAERAFAEADEFVREHYAAAVPETAPVEFIDDRGSWTVPVPPELQAMADAMGLQIEVRVWRS